jgi:trehalose 6-phosphate phosphatase
LPSLADERKGARRHPPPAQLDWAYFFDIDGTLIELANSPAEVVIDEGLAPLLQELSRGTGGAVALITGRAIADVDGVIQLSGIPIAGQHGATRRDADGRTRLHSVSEEGLSIIRERLVDIVAKHPLLRAEFKGSCIALHYRAAPKLGGFAHRLMRDLCAAHAPEFALQPGKRIVEIRPAGRDKGVVIREFMGEAPFADRLPVFVGDDVTDELGFDAINAVGGHSIKVGPGRTRARWRLRDVSAVRAWLGTALQPPHNVREDW